VKKLKGGIIGLGRMGITHLGILNTHPDVEIVCVCEESNYIAGIFKEVKKINVYSDYRKMLSNEELDFIVISTPVRTHYEIIKEAINKNIHIFCEKPFTYTLEEGKALIEALDLKNQTLPSPIVNQIGYVNRYNPVFSYVKSLLDNNVIGKITDYSYEINGAVVVKELGSIWRAKKESGGGSLLELGTHAINLLIWYFGFPKEVVGSVKKKIYSSEVEDLVHAILIFENGITGWISSNWSDETLRKVTEKFEINGLGGKIIVTRQFLKIYLKSEYAGNLNLKKGWNTIYITDISHPVRFYLRGYEFTLQLDDFINSIIEKKGNYRSNFKSGLDTDRVIHMINQNAMEVQK
jgi:predicted dehydrogenase